MGTLRPLLQLQARRTVAGVEWNGEVLTDPEGGYWLGIASRHPNGDTWNSNPALLAAKSEDEAVHEAHEAMSMLMATVQGSEG